LLIEVEDVGGKERWFPANVVNGFLHILLNEPCPIDGPDSAHGSEQGVCHCDAEPLRFLRTKDGHNELNYHPFSIVPAIPGMESVFRIMIPCKFAHIEIVFAVGPPFTLPGRKSANLRLDSVVHFFGSY